MRIANLKGRLVILQRHGDEDVAVDVESASKGLFKSDPDEVYRAWDDFVRWAARAELHAGEPVLPGDLDAPVLRPTQVFGIGLNYRDHAAESGVAAPDSPAVFTKFPTCLTGPTAAVELPSATVDWEVELVAVIGSKAERVPEEAAWSFVAGLTVGQDISERTVQLAGPVPQFSLGKSFAGFGPIGPWLVTPDELTDPDDLELGCSVDGRTLQRARTSDMIFSVPALIARLSAVLPLLPGDLIFTGTPPGVGMARTPKEFMRPGTTLNSYIEGIGELRNPIVAGRGYLPPAADDGR